MTHGITIAVTVILVLTGVVAFASRARSRRRRWQAIEAQPAAEEGAPVPEPSPGPPGLERHTLSSLELSSLMARAVSWADQAEAQGRGFWRDARGDAGPEEYLELWAQVQDLLPEVFGGDVLGLTPGDPPELSLRVDGQLWVVSLQRQEGFLDECFWTLLNRVLEARGRAERIAAPRLANWRVPVVVSSIEELRELRQARLGFIGFSPPLFPSPEGDGLRFHKRPLPDRSALLRELSAGLGVSEDSARVALDRVGRLLCIHLRKYHMLQLGSFGSFQLRIGPAGTPHLRFRAARPLRERVANPVAGGPMPAIRRLPALDLVTLQAVVNAAVQQLSLGPGAVEIPGFGCFWRDLRPASLMRHAQNQQPLLIPARRDVCFEPVPALLEPEDSAVGTERP
jgi:nucleoid DNA-binding protein